jgi:geranylgeranyl diphosphate synthase type II
MPALPEPNENLALPHDKSMKTQSLERRMALVGARVDRALHGFLPPERTAPGDLHKAMRYSVFAGGKRLRPFLCIGAAELCGGTAAKVMPTACALEVLHTYSLVHDDLPAMDDDDLRRGRPTNHKVFGEGGAILAGDALLTFAFELIARNARVKGVSSAGVVAAVETVAREAGALGMVGGQAADLEAEGAVFKNGSREIMLRYIHSRKTGALIRASLKAGAFLVGGTPAQVKALDAYGEQIGLAFQIADDVLDIVGDKKLLGKSGSDRDNNKLTFPAVYGLDDSRRKGREAVERAKKALAPFGRRARSFQELADFIIERKK